MKKTELLELYITNYVAPILIESMEEIDLKNGVEIEGDCDVTNLQGHFNESGEYQIPYWLKILIENSDKKRTLLIIKNITDIEEDDQMKFYEIMKYRKLNTIQIPDNCVIIATCGNLKEKPINQNIYPLMAHIKL